jgi:hypothetical protein
MSPVYYCHSCARKRGYLSSMQTGSLTNTSYQLGKYIKHTNPDPKYNVQSVFNSSSTQAYRDYIVSSSLSGSVEIDDQGRRSVIWGAGKEIGFRYENGALKHPEDVVKVVLSTHSGSIHAYSQSSTQFGTARCVDCGDPVLY